MGDVSHRFAAVLAADVARFSSRMELDAEATVRGLRDCRAKFHKCIAVHHGREFGSVGDSLMAEFSSPVEALRAARDFQSQLAGEEDHKHLQLRIGLHAGDVIVDGDDLFGDVVNTASRLQELAKPDGIAMSGFVYEQVRKEPGFDFSSLGRHSLKNIAEPVLVYEVAKQHALSWRRLKLAILPYRIPIAATLGAIFAGILIIAYLEFRGQPGIGTTIEVPPVDQRSISVLPFADQSEDEDNEHFALGLTEDIKNMLLRAPELNVTIGMPDPDSATPRAAYVLQGSVAKSGNRVRITARLTNATTGVHTWSNYWDRPLTDIFEIQSEIAGAVATALRVSLPTTPRAGGTTSIEAYDLMLQARHARDKGTEEGWRQGERLLIRALAIDPEFGNAWGFLAENYMNQTSHGLLDPAEGYRQARAAIERTLSINPGNVGARAQLAHISMAWDQDFVAAARELRRVLDLAPKNYGAMNSYAYLLQCFGRFDDAEQLYRRAIDLRPETLIMRSNLALLLIRSGKFDEAEEQIEAMRANDPESDWINRHSGTLALRKGDAELALRHYLEVKGPKRNWVLAHAYHTLGRSEEARTALERWVAERRDYGLVRFAAFRAYQGRTEEAFEWLERAYDEGDPALFDLRRYFAFDPMNDDPRWTGLLERMGLDDKSYADLDQE